MQNRLTQLVESEEAHGEKISVLAQGLFCLIMAVVYFSAPKGFSVDPTASGVEPTKLFFLFYGPLLAVRFIFVLKKMKSHFLTYSFLFLDIALLTFLIWSFHVQYSVPVSFVLKAPTFLYYFIFISLRCLSFDYKRLLFIGACTIASWATMTILAFREAGIVITRNFTDYGVAHHLLIGAEIDKMIAVAAVSCALAYAVAQKRKLLLNYAQKVMNEASLERLIGKEAIKSIQMETTSLEIGKGTRRKAATMMVDLRGFSDLCAENSVDQVLRYLNAYYKIVVELIYKHNGSVDKYLGDGILAHFGAVQDSAHYAADAMRAMLEISEGLEIWRAEMLKLNLTIDFGISVAVGDVIFGAVGHEDRLEITVIGEAVNTCAKLEKHTKTLKQKILTTLETFEDAKTQGFLNERGYRQHPASDVFGLKKPLDLVTFDL